jgi:hypothetical protein
MRMAYRLAGLVLAAWLALPPLAGAADQQSQPPAQQTPAASSPRRADFLFGRPRGSFGIRGNWLFSSAGSDLFDFVTEHLTLEKADFNAPGFGGDIAFALSPRLQLEAGVESNRMSQASEYRAFVDNDLRPIEQRTWMRTTYLSAGIRYALSPRGDDVSSLAWIPRRVVPFVGGGAGVMFYEFRQSGDFVDFVDLSVFADSFRSQGWAPARMSSAVSTSASTVGCMGHCRVGTAKPRPTLPATSSTSIRLTCPGSDCPPGSTCCSKEGA